jgi:hypothetical protein
MQLPFSIVFEPPSRADIRRALRTWWMWAIGGAIVALLGLAVSIRAGQVQPGATVGRATLVVNASAPGAFVELDGQERGGAPAGYPISPGEHLLTVRKSGFFDAVQRLIVPPGVTRTATLELWPRDPRLLAVRPAFPGAAASSVEFLEDGRLALAVTLPPGDERQLWLLDGEGELRRFGPPNARGALAVAPGGGQVAYLARGPRPGFDDARLDEVWVTARDGEPGERLFALDASVSNERLFDLSWAPDGRHLLTASREQLTGGGLRTRLRLLDLDSQAGGPARGLVSLPSEIVPDSYSWSPSGDFVAFLARAGQATSLCLLGVPGGQFRYLADLSRDDPSPLPFAPVAWSPDGRHLLYTAPPQDRTGPGGWPFGGKPAPALFAAQLTSEGIGLGKRLGESEGYAPIWRPDGVIYALARPRGDGPLVLRAVDPKGPARDLAELPLKTSSSFAARWDAAHAQALIAIRGAAGLEADRPEYWLLQFRPEAGR